MNNELEKIREFLNRSDLVGTDLKLKESTLRLDGELVTARKDLEDLQKLLNDKQLEVLSKTQKIEGFCSLILELMNDEEINYPDMEEDLNEE